MKLFLARLISNLNKFLSKKLNLKEYFFFVKYIFPILIKKKISFNLKFSFNKNKKLFFVQHSKFDIKYFNILSRAPRYVNGFSKSGEYLFKKYLLNYIKFKESDIVVDIGSNIGELSYYLSKLKLFIYCVDIEKKNLKVLKENLKNYKKFNLQNIAIYKTNGIFPYLSDIGGASSSMLLPKNIKNLNKNYIKSMTLDTFYLRNKIKKSKLIKIDAEGAEPEVLEKSSIALKRNKFIAIECGKERYGKTTIVQVKKKLAKENYKTIKSVNYNILAINKKFL